MCTKVCRVPYVVIVCVLGVSLVFCEGAVNVDGWGSLQVLGFRYGHVAEAYVAFSTSDCELERSCGSVCSHSDVGYLAAGDVSVQAEVYG